MTYSLELTDGVVMLTPYNLEDAEAHLRGEDIEMQKWLSGGQGTIETARNTMKHSRETWEKDGPVFISTIRTVKDGKLVGYIDTKINTSIEGIEEGDANIAYGLYPEARGKGYMVRAVNLIQVYLKVKGIKRAVIRVNPENTNSQKVPIRCGFTKTGEVVTKKEGLLIRFVKEID